jgi:hypothetical protein
MKNVNARFVAGQSTLVVYMRSGKRGLNVGTSIKVPGKKAVTGCQQTFAPNGEEGNTDHEVEAMALVTKLREQAIEKGWTEKTRPPKKERVKKDRDAFKEVPTPDDVPVIIETVEANKPAPKAAVDQNVVDAANNLTEADNPPAAKSKAKKDGGKKAAAKKAKK